MQFIVITRRRVESFSEAEFAEFLDPEAARARELYAQGAFRGLYSRGDVPGAVIELEAASEEEAAALVDSLPFARNDMMEYQLVPLRPYRGFVF